MYENSSSNNQLAANREGAQQSGPRSKTVQGLFESDEHRRKVEDPTGQGKVAMRSSFDKCGNPVQAVAGCRGGVNRARLGGEVHRQRGAFYRSSAKSRKTSTIPHCLRISDVWITRGTQTEEDRDGDRVSRPDGGKIAEEAKVASKFANSNSPGEYRWRAQQNSVSLWKAISRYVKSPRTHEVGLRHPTTIGKRLVRHVRRDYP